MILGKVVGSLVSTIKHACFETQKIMLVSPTDRDGIKIGDTIVAVDTVRAGIGDMVLVASEGRSAQEILMFKEREPLRSVIIGIVDRVEIKKW